MKKCKRTFAVCRRQIGEIIVQNGLAVTPSQVLEMAEKGIAASAQMNSMMVDGHTGSDWNVPLEERRGIDIAALWQSSMDARKKMQSAHKNGTPVNANTD